MKITHILKSAAAALLFASTALPMNAKTSYIFLADGVEEVEAVATVDALRRAGMEVTTVSINDTPVVTGATQQKLVADSVINDINPVEAEWIIIPGGDPGAQNLHNNLKVNQIVIDQWNRGGRVASICAGPAVMLAPTGILKGMKATCYPGLQDALTTAGATYEKQPVVVDGRLITSEGPATTLQFAKAIITATLGAEKADSVLASMLLE